MSSSSSTFSSAPSSPDAMKESEGSKPKKIEIGMTMMFSLKISFYFYFSFSFTFFSFLSISSALLSKLLNDEARSLSPPVELVVEKRRSFSAQKPVLLALGKARFKQNAEKHDHDRPAPLTLDVPSGSLLVGHGQLSPIPASPADPLMVRDHDSTSNASSPPPPGMHQPFDAAAAAPAPPTASA